MSDVQLANRIAGGLHPISVFALGEVLGRSRVIGPIIPEATLRRARKFACGPLPPSESYYLLGALCLPVP